MPIEKKILDSRLSGLSFSQLNELDLRIATDTIIIEGTAIVGCVLPQTEMFADSISKKIAEFINEFGYGELTLDEIMLAFFINLNNNQKMPAGIEIDRVKFYGTCMNVEFISDILSNYNRLRKYLDRKFQNEIDGY